jgi:serine/threonine-protein kinase
MSSVTIGKYRLIAEIGRGGMAEVFLAVNNSVSMSFSKLVVVKKLREHLASEADFMTMLIDEARIAARLNHPNLVQTIEVDEAGGTYFLTMEYLDGQPLHRVLSRARATIPLSVHLSILVDVLAGMHYAHDLKDYDGSPLHIVHRDVTPHNCFVTYEGQVKVVDFGIAKAAGRSSETRHGVVKGKTAYMAPEQACGQQMDRRVDVFAIGVMLYEAACRQRMWKGVSETDIVRRLVTGAIPSSPQAVDPSVDDELDRICRKALMHSSNDRYQSAQELQVDLEAYLASKGGRPSPREVGGYVAQLFADKRATTDKVIETQLAHLRADGRAFKASTSSSNDALAFSSSSNSKAMSSTSNSKVVAGGPTSGAVPTSSVASSGGSGLMSITPGAAAITNRPAAEAPRTAAAPAMASPMGMMNSPGVRPLLAAAAVLMLVTAGTVVGTFSTSSRSGAPPVASIPSRPVSVTLRATPIETRFSIDNGPWQDNPYVGSFPSDSKPHVIRAQAPGYPEKQETVNFNADVSVRFTLSNKK